MDIGKIKTKFRRGQYHFSLHAEIEAEADDLDFAQIVEAILNSDILEEYTDTGRGESCLLVGFSENTAIHAVCGYRAGFVVVVTVYIPTLPKFIDPWTRAGKK